MRKVASRSVTGLAAMRSKGAPDDALRSTATADAPASIGRLTEKTERAGAESVITYASESWWLTRAPSATQSVTVVSSSNVSAVNAIEPPAGEVTVPLSEVKRVIAIGSDKMMNAVRQARHGVLAPYLRQEHCAVGSINSPMQCMMKEICAQCLQRHVDPRTGAESFVFSCFNQDQDLDAVDFAHLDARLRANSVLEKQADQYLGHLLSRR